jgi:hypothetical protein
VHEGAGLLGGGAGGECENGDNAEHLSEVAAGTEGGGATKRGEINKKAGPGCRRGKTHSLRVGEKAAPAATASLPETYTGSIKRSVNASKTHEGEQNDGGPAGHMAGGRARGWGGGRSAGGSGWGPGRWRERASRCEPAQCAHPHGTPRARSQATHALLPRLSSQRGACGAHTRSHRHTLCCCTRHLWPFSSLLFLRPDRIINVILFFKF